MDLTPFTYGDTEVRVIVGDDGEPRFVLADLCKVLGISNPSMVATRLDPDTLSPAEAIDSMGRTRQVTVVTEPGMYEVVIRSDKPEAAAFRRWITTEVLPAIRKHGGYLTPAAVEQALTDPDFIIGLATRLKEEQAAREIAEARAVAATAYAEQLEPAADRWSEVMDAEGTYDLNAVAKMLGTGRVRLMARLRADGILNADNLPRQSHVDCGRFVVKVGRPWSKPDGTTHVSRSTRVTAKGLDWLASRYGTEAVAMPLDAGWSL